LGTQAGFGTRNTSQSPSADGIELDREPIPASAIVCHGNLATATADSAATVCDFIRRTSSPRNPAASGTATPDHTCSSQSAFANTDKTIVAVSAQIVERTMS
jgi:hypothetical protein